MITSEDLLLARSLVAQKLVTIQVVRRLLGQLDTRTDAPTLAAWLIERGHLDAERAEKLALDARLAVGRRVEAIYAELVLASGFDASVLRDHLELAGPNARRLGFRLSSAGLISEEDDQKLLDKARAQFLATDGAVLEKERARGFPLAPVDEPSPEAAPAKSGKSPGGTVLDRDVMPLPRAQGPGGTVLDREVLPLPAGPGATVLDRVVLPLPESKREPPPPPPPPAPPKAEPGATVIDLAVLPLPDASAPSLSKSTTEVSAPREPAKEAGRISKSSIEEMLERAQSLGAVADTHRHEAVIPLPIEDATPPPEEPGVSDTTVKLAAVVVAPEPASVTTPPVVPQVSAEPAVAPTVVAVERAPAPEPTSIHLRPGETFAGLVVRESLGHGGMGAVYAAVDARGNRRAVKVSPPGDAESRERFRREAEALAKIPKHTNVIEVHDVGEERRLAYCVTDFVPGEPLDEVLRRGLLPIGRSLEIAERIAIAVAHVHAHGVLHRDVKPSNIMMRQADGEPVLIDFGVALDPKLDRLTRTGEVLGSPLYMSPEQVLGVKDLDARTDVYSIGATLFFILTGETAVRGETPIETFQKIVSDTPLAPSSLRREVPAGVDAVVARALEKKREVRYQSAIDLVRDLARIRAELTRRSAPEADQAPERSRLLPVLIVLAVVSMAILGIAIKTVLG